MANTKIEKTKYLYANKTNKTSNNSEFSYYLVYYKLTCGMWVVRKGDRSQNDISWCQRTDWHSLLFNHKWRGRDSNPHRSTATFRKRASLLPVSRRELPPSRTFNSFQCLCNPLPICAFRERREATFYPTQQTRSSFWEPLYLVFTVPFQLGDLPKLPIAR